MSGERDGADGRQVRVLRLAIEAGAEPIRGRVGAGGELGEEFVGWLELARALEQALAVDPRPAR